MNVADIRAHFPGLKDAIYLNTATMSVGSAPARAAYERAVDQWCAGRFDWLEAERAGSAVPRLCAVSVSGNPPLDDRLIPVADADAVMTRLRAANVVASVRAFL